MPTTSTELILIRHGETVWNQQGRWQGHLDSDLTPEGLDQARALARQLAHDPVDAIHASDLGRAMRTAEIIAASTNHAIIAEPGLRERALGVFQGLTVDEMRIHYAAEYDRFLSRDPEYVIPGGESLRQKHERGIACLIRIARAYSGHRIAVVTHGGILDAAIRHALAAGHPVDLTLPRRWKLFNASINLLQASGDRFTVQSWGDTLHLRDARSLDDY